MGGGVRLRPVNWVDERTQSKVKIIHNYLWAAMSPDRLEDLVQISSERDIAVNIKFSKLVEVF